MSLWVGLGGTLRNGCAALGTDEGILGICEQERITRVSAAGFNPSGLPDEAIDELLRRTGRQSKDVTTYIIAEVHRPVPGIAFCDLEHHYTHACAAFLPSAFESATIVVCDHEAPQISIWNGCGQQVSKIDWRWEGPGFAEIYSECARVLGFGSSGSEQRMEAMARLEPGHREERVAELFRLEQNRLEIAEDWRTRLDNWIKADHPGNATRLAAALQSHLSDLLVEFLEDVQRRTGGERRLCVGGSLFFNSDFNSRVKLCGAFDDVFVPINPGNAGLAVGAVLHSSARGRQRVSPFLGPAYSSEEIKGVLDNCKLSYRWVSETDKIGIVVDALQAGHLVAWFDGPMEWGPRALGARSILANPFSPYVLENLNRFLKQRDPWRGYALSGLETSVEQHFIGPPSAPFMECDYVARDRDRFRHILPGPHAGVRVHVAGSEAPSQMRTLLHAFGEATGMPFLVNTSFNGFREPIVCSPRDAVRVFFGTGVDVLAIDHFIINK